MNTDNETAKDTTASNFFRLEESVYRAAAIIDFMVAKLDMLMADHMPEHAQSSGINAGCILLGWQAIEDLNTTFKATYQSFLNSTKGSGPTDQPPKTVKKII